jgi:hypothetical protein
MQSFVASNSLARPLGAPLGMGARSDSLSYWEQVKNIIGSGFLDNPAQNTSLSLNGSTAGVTLHSDAFAAGWNGAEFFAVFRGQISPEVWADGQTRRAVQIWGDANNFVLLQKDGTGIWQWLYKAGGTQKIITSPLNDLTGRFTLGITVSKTNNRVIGYLNGYQIGLAQTGLGTWAGGLIAADTRFGDGKGSYYTSGMIEYVCTGNREATPAEMRQIAMLSNPTVISVIGDSISAPYATWPYLLAKKYRGGEICLMGHAVAGQSINGHMAAQAAATAGDNAHICIMALGTNDDNAGDMIALRAKVEAGIDIVRANNPGVTIEYMNVLPRYDGVAKDNIRAMLVTACANKGVPCWDTVSDPWILQADTSDNLHPTAAGHDKITAQVLERLSTANGTD